MANVTLLLGASLLTLVSLEAAFRVISGVPVFAAVNWREDRAERNNMRSAAVYDPVLGWRMRDYLKTPTLNTTEYGIRINESGKYDLPAGAVLAVGDSFTAGSETNDEGSWPAHLERLIGKRVLNAGVGGYGLDQSIMRAEQLIPILAPSAVVVGALDQDILRVGYSRYGAPKPYHTIDTSGALKLHNVPVERSGNKQSNGSFVINLVAHSFVLDYLLSSFTVGWYAPASDHSYKRVNIDEVQISCALLARLKSLLDIRNTPGYFVMQYGGYVISAGQPRPAFAVSVLKCAAQFGYHIVDEYDQLRAVATESVDEFKTLYVMGPGGEYGHMSSAGNHVVAQMIAAVIRSNPDSLITDTAYVVEPLPSGDGINRLTGTDSLSLGAAASGSRFEVVDRPRSARTVYRLTATGGVGEHHVRLFPPLPDTGAFTLSLEVRPRRATRLRLQLLDSTQSGALADFEFSEPAAVVTRLGAAESFRADIERTQGGWARIWVGGVLPQGGIIGILQLLDEHGSNVFAGDQSVEFRAVQLERGVGPSTSRATSH